MLDKHQLISTISTSILRSDCFLQENNLAPRLETRIQKKVLCFHNMFDLCLDFSCTSAHVLFFFLSAPQVFPPPSYFHFISISLLICSLLIGPESLLGFFLFFFFFFFFWSDHKSPTGKENAVHTFTKTLN